MSNLTQREITFSKCALIIFIPMYQLQPSIKKKKVGPTCVMNLEGTLD